VHSHYPHVRLVSTWYEEVLPPGKAKIRLTWEKAATSRTYLAYHHNAKLHTLETSVKLIKSVSALDEANRMLFKQASDDDYVVVITDQTIFHAQGGGQPSDVGSMQTSICKFDVESARMDAHGNGQVLHFGRFAPGSGTFTEGETVEQTIDGDKRLLYSRFHTAGHVLGAAVRHLLEEKIPNFDELKASHFPDSAACEFQGLIEGKWKESIQKKVDDYVQKAMPVEIDWWDEEDFKKNDLERLVPDGSLAPPGEKFRVVKIVGAEVYPCGGTHVDSTDLCGKTNVKKISRSKGNSRVSYNVS
jgi:Ser-tRNA(Ala) deacylase AlaX